MISDLGWEHYSTEEEKPDEQHYLSYSILIGGVIDTYVVRQSDKLTSPFKILHRQ